MAFYPYAAFNRRDPVSTAVDPFADAMRNIVNYQMTKQAEEEQYDLLMEERDRLEKIRVEGVDLAAAHRLEDREDREALLDEGRALRLMGELPSGQLTKEQYDIITPHSKRTYLQEERPMIAGTEMTPTYWLGQTKAEVQQDIENQYKRRQAGMERDQFAQDIDLRGRSLTAQIAATEESAATRAATAAANLLRQETGGMLDQARLYMNGIQSRINDFWKGSGELAGILTFESPEYKAKATFVSDAKADAEAKVEQAKAYLNAQFGSYPDPGFQQRLQTTIETIDNMIPDAMSLY